MGRLYLGDAVIRMRNSGLFHDVLPGRARVAGTPASKIIARSNAGTDFTMVSDAAGLYDEADVARVIRAAR